MRLDRHVIENIDTDRVVAINKYRSYRDGDLMHLNFVILDKQYTSIFSIEVDTNRYADSDEISMAVAGYDFDFECISNKLYIHAKNREWFGSMDAVKVMNKLNDTQMGISFIGYIGFELLRQASELVESLDFFSLQTKEEYEVHENKINEFISTLRNVLLKKIEDKQMDSLMSMLFYMGKEVPILTAHYREFLHDELHEGNLYVWLMERQIDLYIDIAYKEASLLELVEHS